MGQVQIKSGIFIIFLFPIIGCAPIPSVAMKNSISFYIQDDLKGQNLVYKNNWPQCRNSVSAQSQNLKYIVTGNTCKVSPEGYVPEEIVIEYAPWLTYAQQQEIPELRAKETFLYKKAISPDTGNVVDELIGRDEAAIEYNTTILRQSTQNAIDKLPASAWKKIVLHPAELVSKYRFTTPDGNGNRLRGKEIHYIITLNPDGSYKVEDKLYWVSPYSKNWN